MYLCFWPIANVMSMIYFKSLKCYKIFIENLWEFLHGFIFKVKVERNLNSNTFAEKVEFDFFPRQLFLYSLS